MTSKAIICSAVMLLGTAVVAEASCTGGLGRGWGGGQGSGKFTMSAGAKSCQTGFANFIDDRRKTQVPATKVTVTKQPKAGKVQVTGRGVVYTPNKGFKGTDNFCTRNASPKVRGTLGGCIQVVVK